MRSSAYGTISVPDFRRSLLLGYDWLEDSFSAIWILQLPNVIHRLVTIIDANSILNSNVASSTIECVQAIL